MNPALPVPARVDAAGKLALITLIGEAMDAGFTRDGACEVLKLQPRPFPSWATYTPNSIWIHDSTHFPWAGVATLIIEDLVSRKWVGDVTSVEETHTQVEIAFEAALWEEGLYQAALTRAHLLGLDRPQSNGEDELTPLSYEPN